MAERGSGVTALGSDLTYLRRMAQAGRQGPPLGGLLMAAFGGYIGAGAGLLWAGETMARTMGHYATTLGIGFLVFTAIACSSGGRVSRRRLGTAAASSGAAILALSTIYALILPMAMFAVRQRGGPDPADLPVALITLLYVALPPLLLLGGLGVLAVVLLRLRRHPAALAPGNVVAGAVWSGGMLAMAAIITVFVVQGLAQRARLSEDVSPVLRDAVMAAGLLTVPAVFWVMWALAWWIWGLATARRWPFLVAAASVANAIWYARTMDLLASSTIGLFVLVFVPGTILMREEHRRSREERA